MSEELRSFTKYSLVCNETPGEDQNQYTNELVYEMCLLTTRLYRHPVHIAHFTLVQGLNSEAPSEDLAQYTRELVDGMRLLIITPCLHCLN